MPIKKRKMLNTHTHVRTNNKKHEPGGYIVKKVGKKICNFFYSKYWCHENIKNSLSVYIISKKSAIFNLVSESCVFEHKQLLYRCWRQHHVGQYMDVLCDCFRYCIDVAKHFKLKKLQKNSQILNHVPEIIGTYVCIQILVFCIFLFLTGTMSEIVSNTI